ncbi:MAG: ATP-binding protein [Candidatus Aminicenantes bacterium]|nr:ATP-binding protein [Candidatus Aminicenantes bacterium]MCK5004204.1 ATP-binding protein [Candidatus Aminicenantes bacterium]
MNGTSIKDFENKYKRLLSRLYDHPLWMETNWFLATGAPSSGKSTSLRRLQKEGYNINPDISRDYIVDLKRRGIPFRKDVLYSVETQNILFYLMTHDALGLDTGDLIIHDYSLPDNIAFLKLGGLPVPDEVKRSAMSFRFRKVFLFEPLELIQDGVRTEDRADQERLFQLLHETYISLGYDPILVKSDTIENRHKFLIKRLPEL